MNESRPGQGQAKINYEFKLLYLLLIVFVVSGHYKSGEVSIFYDWFPIYSFALAGTKLSMSGFSDGTIGLVIDRDMAGILIPVMMKAALNKIHWTLANRAKQEPGVI